MHILAQSFSPIGRVVPSERAVISQWEMSSLSGSDCSRHYIPIFVLRSAMEMRREDIHWVFLWSVDTHSGSWGSQNWASFSKESISNLEMDIGQGLRSSCCIHISKHRMCICWFKNEECSKPPLCAFVQL